jgi:hypothetical protein
MPVMGSLMPCWLPLEGIRKEGRLGLLDNIMLVLPILQILI